MTKAAGTRLNILRKAFELIYKKGYQATSIDDILAHTKVTKGAFYYHFRNKDQMGLAMIREVMAPGMRDALVTPLLHANDPLKAIYLMMENVLLDNPFFDLKYGCPAVNLIEEMAPLNEDFKNTLEGMVVEWQQAIETALEKGRSNGKVAESTDPARAAGFVSAGYSGARNMGKLFGKDYYLSYLQELKHYLNSFK